MTDYSKDIEIIKKYLKNIPKQWDGKLSILELKEANFNWRQMEWWGFFFEYKVRQLLKNKLTFPGDKIGNVSFDIKGAINWDLKIKALNDDEFYILEKHLI